MPNGDNKSIVVWLKCLLICIILILPARFYNGFYLHAFEIDSNISVQYMNVVDLAIVSTTIVFILGHRKFYIERRLFRFFAFYALANAVMLTAGLFCGQSDGVGELISKTTIIFCCCVVASQFQYFSDLQKTMTYLGTLAVLVIASFFLTGYQGYGTMNRVGSLGFGTNETACFACCLFAVALFVKNINVWIRLGGAILSAACVLNVASRRGMLIEIAILVIWIIVLLFKRKSSRVSIKGLALSIVIFGGLLWVTYSRFDQIVKYVNGSAFMIRLRFAEQYNNNFMDFSDRTQIYKNIGDYINTHLLFGAFGCDTILGQGTISHAHNVLLQFIATHGLFFGTIISSFFVVTTYKAIRLMIDYIKYEGNGFPAVLSLFFLLYMSYDLFGYLLWNPKGLFWVGLTMFMIQMEYSSQVKRIEHED